MQSLKAVGQFVKSEASGDGHSIYFPKFFLDMGFSPDFVKRFTFKHKSDGTHKGNIYKDGEVLKSLEGVASLSFAYGIAGDIGADTKQACSKMGRGSQAGELSFAISNKLKELEAEGVGSLSP